MQCSDVMQCNVMKWIVMYVCVSLCVIFFCFLLILGFLSLCKTFTFSSEPKQGMSDTCAKCGLAKVPPFHGIGWWRGTPTYNGGNKDKETSDIYKILVYIGFIYSCFRKLRERGRVFLSLAFFLLRCLSFIWCESLKQKKAGKIFDMISWACLRDNFELGKFILTSRITFSIPAAPNVPDKYGQTIRPSYRGVCRTGWL